MNFLFERRYEVLIGVLAAALVLLIVCPGIAAGGEYDLSGHLYLLTSTEDRKELVWTLVPAEKANRDDRHASLKEVEISLDGDLSDLVVTSELTIRKGESVHLDLLDGHWIPFMAESGMGEPVPFDQGPYLDAWARLDKPKREGEQLLLPLVLRPVQSAADGTIWIAAKLKMAVRVEDRVSYFAPRDEKQENNREQSKQHPGMLKIEKSNRAEEETAQGVRSPN